jgi:hypothetical protein
MQDNMNEKKIMNDQFTSTFGLLPTAAMTRMRQLHRNVHILLITYTAGLQYSVRWDISCYMPNLEANLKSRWQRQLTLYTKLLLYTLTCVSRLSTFLNYFEIKLTDKVTAT